MNKKARLLVLYVVIATFFSCSTGNRNSEMAKVVQSTVSFTNNLKQLSNGVLYEPDSVFKLLGGQKKIVSIVDGVCMKCVINDLNYADEVFQEIIGGSNGSQVVYILNVPPADSLYFLKHFEPSINVKGIVLWDDSYSFEKSNELLTPDKSDRTFLLDEENQIKLIGNPLYDPELMEEYKKSIHQE